MKEFYTYGDMIMNKLLLSLLFIAPAARAMDVPAPAETKSTKAPITAFDLAKNPSSIGNTQITDQNLAELMRKFPFTPVAQKATKDFIQKYSSLIGILGYLPDVQEYEAGKYRSNAGLLHQTMNELISVLGLKSQGQGHNYALEVPKTDLLLKTAGPANRLWNWLAYNDQFPWSFFKNREKAQKQGKLKEFWTKIIENRPEHLYQTVSNAAYYLRAMQAINELDLKNIRIAPTTLAHIPGTPLKPVSDSSYVVIQKRITNQLVRIKEEVDGNSVQKITEAFKGLTPPAVVNFMRLIVAAGIWDTRSNLAVDGEGNIVYYDLEQPNASQPQTFYMQNIPGFYNKTKHYQQDVRTGILQLAAGVQSGNGKKLPGYIGNSILRMAYDQGYKVESDALYKAARGFYQAHATNFESFFSKCPECDKQLRVAFTPESLAEDVLEQKAPKTEATSSK